jgi:hypothetical protein
MLAAGVLGLVLAGGFGGVATAATADGPGPHGPGDRGSMLTVDAGDGAGQPTNADGHGGRR